MATSIEPHENRVIRHLHRNGAYYAMLAPAAVLLLINNYIPMAGILIAFKSWNYGLGFWNSPWVGFENFEYLFRTTDALVITRNTILYNTVFIAINVVFGVLLAIAVSEMHGRRLAKFYQSAILLPFFMSWVVVSYLVFSVLSMDLGVINTRIFPLLGIAPVNWYMTAKPWVAILPVVNTWKSVGYSMVIYLAAITSIDPELYQAAVIDGAGKWQQAMSITVPLIAPVIVIVVLLQVGRIFYADFGLFFQVTMNSGMIKPTTAVIDTYVFNAFLRLGDTGMATAAGVYQAVVGFALVVVSNLIVRRIDPEKALF